MRTLNRLRSVLSDETLKTHQVHSVRRPYSQISLQCRVCERIITDMNDFHNGPLSMSGDGVLGKDGNMVISAQMCDSCWQKRIDKWLATCELDIVAARNLWSWVTLYDSRITNWKMPWRKTELVACVKYLLSNLKEHDACSIGSKLALLSMIKEGKAVSDAPFRFKKADEQSTVKMFEDPPLIQAVRNKNEKRVRECLEHGASLDERDEYGNTSLIIAAAEGYKRIVKLLLGKGSDVNATNQFDETALLEAVENNRENSRTDIIFTLIESGANVNQVARSGTSILFLAIIRKNMKVLKYLLKHGLDLKRNNCGEKELHYAAWDGSPATIKILIKNGVNINAVSENGETPIMAAANRDKIANVKLLLKLGADISLKNKNGQTVKEIIDAKERKRESLRSWVQKTCD